MNHKLLQNSYKVIEALSIELSLINKPGLVTVDTPNIHKDMDYLFMTKSFHIIGEYYYSLSSLIFDLDINKCNSISEFINLNYEKIINLGKKYEFKLFEFNNGVNTYKGMIYSFGIIAIVDGINLKLNKKSNIDYYFRILEEVSISIINQKVNHKDLPDDTYGSNLRKSKKKDISYISKKGFYIIKDSFYKYCELKSDNKIPAKSHIEDYNYKKSLIFYLFSNIAMEIDDSTIIGKSNNNISNKFKEKMCILNSYIRENPFNYLDIEKKLEKINEYCLTNKISPGGTADLFALTIYVLRIYRKV